MTRTLLLRIASVISFLFTAGHSLGGLTDWSPMGDNEVLRAMRTVRFEIMGASRTYYDFFMGFGHSVSVAMLLQSVLLWQLATIAKAGTVSVRPMIGAFIVASAMGSLVAWHFIFPLAVAFSLVLTACLIAAFLARR
jgi:hypothetical protein